MAISLSEIAALNRILKVSDARAKIASKTNRPSDKQRTLQNYNNARFTQYNRMQKAMKPKHR